MLRAFRHFLFGVPIPSADGLDGIPQEAREAHHELRNTAMRAKRNAQVLERDAKKMRDLLEILSHDIRGSEDRR